MTCSLPNLFSKHCLLQPVDIKSYIVPKDYRVLNYPRMIIYRKCKWARIASQFIYLSVSISARINAVDRGGGRAAAALALSDQVESVEPGGGHGRPEGGRGRQGRTLPAKKRCREIELLHHCLHERAMKNSCNAFNFDQVHLSEIILFRINLNNYKPLSWPLFLVVT